jgi:tungstate transport system ATP-binding protein
MKLVINHIQKAYEGRTVLKDCSYAFGGSGVHVLMGTNGCGKSTLLRICALLAPPDAGELLFSDDETPLAQDLALRRRITLVLPRTGVFKATVFNNVAYGLRLRSVGRLDIERKVAQALAFVGMEHKRNQHALTLSSGETQRMGLARALAIEPGILFLDEPTASVDQENTAIIESIILSMRKAGSTMVIMTTHDRDQAERLADVLLHLREGKIEAQQR